METASMAEVDRYTFMTDYYGNHVVRMEDDHVVKDEEYVLATECDRLQKWVDDLQSGMYVNCVYCGHRYGPCETTPVSMADALKAHVEQCPKHPLFEARQALLREGIRSGAIERERDQLRHAIRKVRAHTCYRPNASRELLTGLLASIERIADEAEHGRAPVSADDTNG
jgi:hypothetical protein